jgi:sulfofructose kinase
VETTGADTSRLLSDIDLVVVAESFAETYTGIASTGQALRALARDTGAALVVATLGERGSLAVCQDVEIATPAFPVDCVDSTGAGDVFRAGLAAGLLQQPNGSVEEILRYANAVAALNCRAVGACGGLPSATEVARLLAGDRA